MSSDFKNGDLVRISGPVNYGGIDYRVEGTGKIIDKESEVSLVLVDEIDGDGLVNVLVRNDIMRKLTDDENEEYKTAIREE